MDFPNSSLDVLRAHGLIVSGTHSILKPSINRGMGVLSIETKRNIRVFRVTEQARLGPQASQLHEGSLTMRLITSLLSLGSVWLKLLLTHGESEVTLGLETGVVCQSLHYLISLEAWEHYLSLQLPNKWMLSQLSNYTRDSIFHLKLCVLHLEIRKQLLWFFFYGVKHYEMFKTA